MRIDLGDYPCPNCWPTQLRGAEWSKDHEPADPEEWYFSEELDSIVQESFEIAGFLRLLLSCESCNRYCVLEANVTGVAVRCLPFSEDDDPLRTVLAEFDPYRQVPNAVYLGRFRAKVIEFSHRSQKWPNPRTGPFYPYPLGRYHLTCEVTAPDGERIAFLRFHAESQHGVGFISRSAEDLDFFSLRVTWIDEGAARIADLLADFSRGKQYALPAFHDANAALTAGSERIQKTLDAADSTTQITTRIRRAGSVARTMYAFRFLIWLERQLRDFIWGVFAKHYGHTGEGWWKDSFPKDVRDAIARNRRGEQRTKFRKVSDFPMDYVDFGQMIKLLQVVWPKFNTEIDSDLDALKGHFRYLRAIRNAVAHA